MFKSNLTPLLSLHYDSVNSYSYFGVNSPIKLENDVQKATFTRSSSGID